MAHPKKTATSPSAKTKAAAPTAGELDAKALDRVTGGTGGATAPHGPAPKGG